LIIIKKCGILHVVKFNFFNILWRVVAVQEFTSIKSESKKSRWGGSRSGAGRKRTKHEIPGEPVVIAFQVTWREKELLSEKRQGDESLHKTARRLLQEVLFVKDS
jgi:hypothetical protein